MVLTVLSFVKRAFHTKRYFVFISELLLLLLLFLLLLFIICIDLYRSKLNLENKTMSESQRELVLKSKIISHNQLKSQV